MGKILFTNSVVEFLGNDLLPAREDKYTYIYIVTITERHDFYALSTNRLTLNFTFSCHIYVNRLEVITVQRG